MEHGADINKEDANGKTPLYRTCERGKLNRVKYLNLISKGANINKENRFGETPLFGACSTGQLYIESNIY